MQKDSVIRTLIVAAVLCIVCSVLVSGSAVLLKEKQEINKKLDIKKNLLQASGLISGKVTEDEINEAFRKIETVVVDLDSGKVTDIDPQEFDQVKARKDSKQNKQISPDKDKAGIKTRSKFAPVYKYMENGKLSMVIFPVNGKGLWSTLYGFLALDADLETVKGIGFYQHGETPGLGGEIDNPSWKASWKGKKVYDKDFEVELRVVKGSVSPSDPKAEYKIDGLSGATITSNGVTGLVRYWMGEDGFKPYIESLKNSDVQESNLEGYNLEEGPNEEPPTEDNQEGE